MAFNSWEQPTEAADDRESQDQLAGFQAMVAELKANEATEGISGHLTDINPTELTITDALMYEKVKELINDLQSVTKPTEKDKARAGALVAEYRQYRQQALGNDHRQQFAAYLGNKITGIPAVYL